MMKKEQWLATYPNGLSEEIKLLFVMTEVYMYEGLEGRNLIKYLDEIRDRKEKEMCNAIARVFCFDQISEKMIDSLYYQNIIWQCVKSKQLRRNNSFRKWSYSNKIKNISGKLEDFQKAKKMQDLCYKMKKVRNKFAHELLECDKDYLLDCFDCIEHMYDEIYRIYAEQSLRFLNRIEAKLKRAIDFMDIEKDYSKDILIIKNEISRIYNKKDEKERDEDYLANLQQMYEFLQRYRNGDRTDMRLYLKDDLLLYKYI